MRLLIGCFLALMSLSLSLQASPKEVYTSSPVYLGLAQQKPQEDRLDFVRRVAAGLSQYTAQTGYEAGGWFCEHRQTKQQVVMVFTERSQIAVTLPKGCPGVMYEMLAEHIHSHPHVRQIRLTGNDLPLHNHGRVFKAKEGQVVVFSPRKFSRGDKKHKQGYMIYRNELYHHIRGRSRLVGLVDLSVPVQWQSSVAVETLQAP